MLRFQPVAVLTLLTGVVLCGATVGCANVESKRIRQLLNEKGFGGRSRGDATLENYVAGGDFVGFFIDPLVVQQPTAARLAFLGAPQLVQVDGTITVPYVGQVFVLGKTVKELSELVSEELQARFTFPIQVEAVIEATDFTRKRVFGYGELADTGRRALQAETTILDFIAERGVSSLANLGRVKVIRPDAENPLVVVINVREMLQTGNTTYNILLRDRDIVYVPPTFVGHVARFLQRVLEPFALVLQTLFQVAATRATVRTLADDDGQIFIGGGGGRFNGF